MVSCSGIARALNGQPSENFIEKEEKSPHVSIITDIVVCVHRMQIRPDARRSRHPFESRMSKSSTSNLSHKAHDVD